MLADPIPFAALRSLGACPDATRWLEARTNPSWSAAWRDCERSDWMLWLLGRQIRAAMHGTPEHRRLIGCLVDIQFALSWPWLHDQDEATVAGPIAQVLDVLARYADGEPISQEALRQERSRAYNARYETCRRWSTATADDATDAAAAVADAAADAAPALTRAALRESARLRAVAQDCRVRIGWLVQRDAAADAAADRFEALRAAADIVREWHPEAPSVEVRP